MKEQIIKAAQALVVRAHASGQSSSTLSELDSESLVETMGGNMPPWYLELLRSVPLIGISFGFGEKDEDGNYPFELVWNGAREIRSESLECYPGKAILERGYFNIASDPIGSGDPYFLHAESGEDPKVFQVYHDISDQADEILTDGLELVAPSLMALLNGASFNE